MAKMPRMPGIECLAAHGRQADVEAAIRRDPSAFADAVRYAPHVPQPLSDAAIAVGGEWIGALARNTDAVAEDPVLRRRLAGTGHPLVARAVFENEYGPWDSVDLRALLAAADGADPDWKPRLSRLRALTRTRENEGRLGAVALLRATWSGGSTGLRAGDRVIAMSHQLGSGRGTWADLVALPAQAVAAAPRSVSLAQAATLPLPGLTALQTLDWLAVKSGERLLIAGAAGAVGGLALQIARARGARVDALVSRDAQGAFARAHGADFVTTDRNTLQDRHYDAVFDTFGAFVTEAVADGGRYASIATQAGPVPDMSSRSVRTTVNQVHEDGTGLDELARLVDDGSLRPRMASVFGLQEIQAAHARFLQGGLAGKIAVVF
ncbi:zinc-binding dehydrogenase [Embleya sp. NPDC127516]|uniref:zinc-binding dehydrogenase n=1 Tax=Embleya sp. NPDC127516 TaxID=3363990 RepID=UPI0037F96378